MTKSRTLKNHHDLRYLTDIPEPPAYFTPELTEIWQQTCEILADRFELTQGDLSMVETYTTTLHAYRQLVHNRGADHLIENAMGDMVVNPISQHILRHSSQLNQITTLLGLNPKSRRDLKEADRKASIPSDGLTGAF